jgi:hypothetical protein
MAPASNEEQFKFLISCIRYSNNGKVSLSVLCFELRLTAAGRLRSGCPRMQDRQQGRGVSFSPSSHIGQANPEFFNRAKRYERMMRAHGIAPNAASVKTQPASRTKTEPRESTTGNGNVPNKKRKAEQFMEDNNTSVADDEEGFATNIKADPVDEKTQLRVKEEEGRLSLDDAANLMQFYDTPSFQGSEFDAGGQDYGASDWDGASSSGYHTPIGNLYGMQDPFNFSTPYDSAGMSSSGMGGSGMSDVIPRFTGLQYQSPYQPYVQHTPNTPITPDNQGGSESPVIVE